MRKIVGGDKDENGIYTPAKVAPPTSVPDTDNGDIAIDDLLKAGLQNIKGAMKAVSSDINTGMPSRETIQNLKDLMSMLKELKKDEKDLLDSMTDDQLKAALKK